MASIGQRSGRQPTVASEPVIRQTEQYSPKPTPTPNPKYIDLVYITYFHGYFIMHIVHDHWRLELSLLQHTHRERSQSMGDNKAHHIIFKLFNNETSYFWNSKAPHCDCDAHIQMDRNLYLNKPWCFYCDWIIVIEIDWDMKRQCSWHCVAVRRLQSFQCFHRNSVSLYIDHRVHWYSRRRPLHQFWSGCSCSIRCWCRFGIRSHTVELLSVH